MASAERDVTYAAYVTARLPWLRRVAFLLCRDWHRADDLVQTTVTKLHANWQRAEKTENLDGHARQILRWTLRGSGRSARTSLTSYGARSIG
jgi:DNA-directed RNA polymerase specialized sigma24 family protein